MRRFPSLILAALFAAILPACSAAGFTGPRALNQPGPATDCATAANEVPEAPEASSAAAAGARGGQEASNQPVQSDPGARGVNTTWNRGSGPNTNSPTTTETRSQAGAPSVNQGLILPTSAFANAAESPAVKALLARGETLRAALGDAIKRNDSLAIASITTALDRLDDRLVAATAAAGGSTTNVYDLRGARVSQIVANGSKSGDGPGGSISPDTAAAVGSAADKVVDATMRGVPEVIPEGPATGTAPATETPR